MAFRGRNNQNGMTRESVLNELQNQASGPNAANMIDILRRNDAKAGEALANNLLNTYGISKEQVLRLARQKIDPKILALFGFR